MYLIFFIRTLKRLNYAFKSAARKDMNQKIAPRSELSQEQREENIRTGLMRFFELQQLMKPTEISAVVLSPFPKLAGSN